MQYFVKINIFKCVEYPLYLASTCQNWFVIAKDPYAKSEWLIVHYGNENALFNAIRLGLSFITSKYFIQRLLTYFNKYDQIEHDVGQIDTDGIRVFQQRKSHRASNLSSSVFTHLLSNNNNNVLKSNVMELFHFLFVGLHKDLILNQRFTSFSPRPKALQLDLSSPSKDGLNLIKFFDYLRQESFKRYYYNSASA